MKEKDTKKNNSQDKEKFKKKESKKFPEGYLEIFKQSFFRIWENPLIWIWGILIPSGFAFQFGGGSSPDEEFSSQGAASFEQFNQFVLANLLWIIIGLFVLLTLSLILWVLSSIARGGLIKKIDKMQNIEGGKSSFKEIWQIGRICFWNVLKVDLWILAFNLLILLFLSLFFVGAFFVFDESINLFFIFSAVFIFILVFLLILMINIAKRIAVIFVVNSGIDPLISIKKALLTILKNKIEFLKLVLLLILINLIIGVALAVASFSILIIVSAPLALFAKLVGLSNAVILLISGVSFAVVLAAAVLFLKAFTALWKLDIWIWWVKKICSKKIEEKEIVDNREKTSQVLATENPGVVTEV
ncbi:MAG: hypothetical protein R6V40_01755 [Candidatus Moraniibacteriota bacterium]